ncbi:hypothetical protein Xbed_03532 [Xenorhabdus beddingii]|uniref:Uncharacterized protein n=1 Tax=Xenorhabdus beddingii TaxID=40578 RepID=A0A1Y2SBR4_9GAMM|nr:hypothetical protein [Xenorhabdus beddingii]OTA16060.1 hypothetical protein Xbed_03532 [Xenorhabdus beddingii]
MNKKFESMIRRLYGNRYSLVRDVEGCYASEVVKRMFEVWREAKGLK